MYISSRMPITSAMNDIMLAVSRTVSPWAIWLFPSSKSCTSRPSRLQADANEKRVRVELSLKRLMPRPLSNILAEMLFSLRCLSASATAKTPFISSKLFSHVRKKSPSYILSSLSWLITSVNCFTLLIFVSFIMKCYFMSLSVSVARNSVASSSPLPL